MISIVKKHNIKCLNYISIKDNCYASNKATDKIERCELQKGNVH